MLLVRFMILVCCLLVASPRVGSAFEQANRAEQLSRNELNNTLMDLRMALEDLKKSRQTMPLKMFSYRQMESNLKIMIRNLEKCLYPKVKIDREAVCIRLNGRYFKAAIEEGIAVAKNPSRPEPKAEPLPDVP